jgi:hypothetical protein
MKREYSTGSAEDITFFTGVEIERTPAYGMQTLFVTGVQPVEAIVGALANQEVRHIFFGANHSFNPNGYAEHKEWEEMIMHFLNIGMWCSLDIPMSQVEEFNEGGLNEYDQFIPQIRVPIPYIKLWNYNTMLKVDDKDFKATNPGVWCHNLHDLLDRNKFTSWDQYGNDEIIK